MEFSSVLSTGATIAGVIAAMLAVALYVYQNDLIYPAGIPPGSRQKVFDPSEFGMQNFDKITLKTEDGVKLQAYVIYGSPSANSTLLYFHANAGNMVLFKFFDSKRAIDCRLQKCFTRNATQTFLCCHTAGFFDFLITKDMD